MAVGLLLAFASSRLIAHMLYEVKTTDPATLFLSTGILFAVTIIATYIPARRASTVHPMVALRTE
jgi:ABC-type antimicrobial peptide transport system permease subunit